VRAQAEPLLTVTDLEAAPEDGNRYEVIEGELYVSTAPGLPHARNLMNIVYSLGNEIRRSGAGELIAGPGVIFSEYSGVIPDLVFISTERREEIASGVRVTGAPDLVIEIVSPGSENSRRDRTIKRRLYSKYGVKEYWVVDPEARAVEIYRPRGKHLALAATLSGNDRVTTMLIPTFAAAAREFFA
jgi:Uma2 family endonuclease